MLYSILIKRRIILRSVTNRITIFILIKVPSYSIKLTLTLLINVYEKKNQPSYCTVHNFFPFICRTSELIALMAISTTLFLFLHTRDLHTRLKEMEVRLQPEDLLSSNQIISGKKV